MLSVLPATLVVLMLLAGAPAQDAADPASSAPAAGEVLGLPSPDTSNSGVQTLSIGGRITLDALGPAIVGEDGTLRRIANWDKLTKREQQVALRRIGQRNQARLAALREQQQQQQQQQQGQEQEAEEKNKSGAAAVAPESREEGAEPGPEKEHSTEVPQTEDRTEL